MEIKEKILNIRNEFNLTQEELAEKLYVSRQTVSNWENGKCYPDMETLILISNKFNINLDSLIKEDKKMIKKIDKIVKKSRHKYLNIILIILTTTILLISFYFGYKLFLLNHYNNDYNNEIYIKYYENLEQLTITRNDKVANSNYYDMNFYIDDVTIRQDYIYENIYKMGMRNVITLSKQTNPFYEFYNKGEYYKNLDIEKIFQNNDIFNPIDLIRYFEIMHTRKPNVFWRKNDIELLFLMKNYIVLEQEYGDKSYKRYYFCNELNGIITETKDLYEIEIYHDNDVYLISILKSHFKLELVKELLSSIYFG